MSGHQRLPPELWKIIIRYATSTDDPVSQQLYEPMCLKVHTPLTPILYHRRASSSQPAVEAFSQLGSKRSIALVCQTFHDLASEYLFEKLYITESKTANRLADTLGNSQLYENPGRWTRHITIVGVFFTYTSASEELASAAVRMLSHTPQLQSFHLTWNSTTREFRERERMIIDAVPSNGLRRFEWDCTGGGFERQHDHPFYRVMNSSKFTLQVLKLTGYLPLAELPMPPSAESQESLRAQDVKSKPNLEEFPDLSHLKIRRAFRDDLLFVSQWSISSSLTCLSLGSVWSYFDSRELAFPFFDSSKPALLCLHLGEGSNVSPTLARRILRSATNLRVLEYFYLGEWERDTWIGVDHEKLEIVKVHVSHPVIALRSLFNSRRFSRDQQWEKILMHVSPFLGYLWYDRQGQHQSQDQNGATANDNRTSSTETRTWYPAMKKLVFLEYARHNEELRYEPEELADWLRTTISQLELETDVQLSVEVEDYIR